MTKGKDARPGSSSRSRDELVSRNTKAVSIKPAQKKPKGWVRWLRAMMFAAVFAFVAGTGAVMASIAYYGRDLPDPTQLRTHQPFETTRILDRRGRLLAELFEERRTVVPMDRVPRNFVLCVLAAEDADFYEHEGLDYPGLLRAVARHLLTGRRLAGTSTITQQIVKNLLLSNERSFTRKMREFILARRIERQFSKDEILGIYLNTINYGHGRYGVQEAARFYFAKNVEDLSLAEASLISGVPQVPTHLSPRNHPEAARRRQLFVLGQLKDKRATHWPDLTEAQIDAAKNAHVPLAPNPERLASAPEIVEPIRQLLRKLVGDARAKRGGFVVKTTLDVDVQRAARESLRETLEAYDSRHRVTRFAPVTTRDAARATKNQTARGAHQRLRVGETLDGVVTRTDDAHNTIDLDVGNATVRIDLDSEDRYLKTARSSPNAAVPSASHFAPRGSRMRVSVLHVPAETSEGPALGRLELGPQGAVVVIDVRTRDVVAMVGAYDGELGFNRATSAVRQPGSTFKPFVFAEAVRTRRLTPATLVSDTPESFDQWRPRNFETWEARGPIRVREALAHSVNLVAVRIARDVGVDNVAKLAASMGISTPLEPTLSLALGASEVKLDELVNAYATFAAGGEFSSMRFITAILDDGKALPLPGRSQPQRVLGADESYLVTSMLESVVQEGTAQAAKQLRRPAAGKTGTANDARDVWFVGYTPEYAAGVWVGYDDRRPLGRRESGGRTALPVWVQTMRVALRGSPATAFPQPPGVQIARVDPLTGLLAASDTANAYDEVFLTGTAPTEITTPVAAVPDPLVPTLAPDDAVKDEEGRE